MHRVVGPKRNLKIALVVVSALVVIAAWRLGLFELFSDPERLKTTLLGMGVAGYLVFLAAFAIMQPVGVPGVVFVVGATYVWPKPIAFALSLLGSLIASTVGFLFARFIARDWIAEKLPPRLRVWDDRIARNGLWTAAVLRIVFFMNPLIHGLFGVSRVRYLTYVGGSALGYAPGLVVVVWASGSAMDYLREQEPARLLPWVGLVVVVFALFRGVRWWRRRSGAPAA